MKMCRLLVGTLSFSFLLAKAAVPDIPVEPSKAQLWQDRRLEEIGSLAGKPKEECLLGLGKMTRQLGVLNYRDCPEKVRVIAVLRSTIFAISGHAEYFGNKIRNDDILREAGQGHEVKGGVVWDFETLGQLPSPETVKVLGSFLDDERHRMDPLPDADVMPVPANDLLAAQAFHSLRIVNPPLQKRPGDYDDIQPWRLWFAQVQAGNRTFRFEGDPQEYNLTGPVATAAEPVVSRPESKGDNALSQEALGKSSKLTVAALAGAIALLIAAVWAVMKRRSTVG